MFVLQAVVLRIIVSALNSKLHVAETFESKHLPVELLLFSKEYQSTSKDRSVLEKLVWDSVKKRSFLSNQLGVRCFKVLSFKLTDLLTRSVDEAVNCLNSGLLEAAACMKRKSTKDQTVVNGLMSSAKRQGKKHVNGGENLGTRNVRRVKAGIGCFMLSVGNPSEIC